MKEIGLIEDDHILRDTYAKYFRITKQFSVVFSVNDIKDALAVTSAQPDIILLDVNLQSGSGIDSIKVLKNRFPKSKIVILSSMEDARLTRKAMENGATGYLLKTSSMTYITESILKIDDGGVPLSPTTIPHVLQFNQQQHADANTELTKRELELIRLLSEGVANKTAADKLNVTYFTINQHLKNIYKKLKINSKAELIAWYLSKRNL
ncbi:response regulator transcription factor [Mucilaginibacter sp. RS28]|uniref:Response regulator transcription factor n=1 Tax=Mucilaginibacter straminoryzae TaxID=2932774 RepID=A0A9X1X108_9SPHI|nr:response regulator transcription factor [Mucilaginibacter straminoryzae]MCJ8208641.1 response regulator transcription factor [Mucilaginibacter straminoryzae]